MGAYLHAVTALNCGMAPPNQPTRLTQPTQPTWLNQWNLPKQLDPAIVFPSVDQVMTARCPPRTSCCFREADLAHPEDYSHPGDWTPMTEADIPKVIRNRQDIIIVFRRFSSNPERSTAEDEQRCRAASAIVGNRLHQTTEGGQPIMQGRTLIILMDSRHALVDGVLMPAYTAHLPKDPVYNHWPLFPTIMEELDWFYSRMDTTLPRLWFVSRSLTSLTFMPLAGFTNFLQRWLAWWPKIRLVYQTNKRWPHDDQSRLPHDNTPPFWEDHVYGIKSVAVPLREAVQMGPLLPVWLRTMDAWLWDDYCARCGAMGEEGSRIVKQRAAGRLGF